MSATMPGITLMVLPLPPVGKVGVLKLRLAVLAAPVPRPVPRTSAVPPEFVRSFAV
jgi:hypothetical protein